MTARKEGLLAWVCCLVFLSTCVGATEELGMAWKKGASYQDATIAAVVGDASGCTFVTGATSGDFGPGSPNLGQRDAYLSKYNADGDVMWVIPLGTEGLDSGSCLTVDAEGNCYVGGQTEGSLAPNLIANTPQLVSKLLPAAIGCEVRGSALSAKKVLDVPQHASEPFSPLALATNLSLDFAAKSVLKPVVDTQQDAFLAKISSEGTCVWIRQFGSAHADGACRVRLDQNGNCYVAGNTTGCIDRTPEDCAGQCPFVAKFDSTGQLVWISQVRDSHAQAGLGVGVDPNGTVALAGAPGYVATFDANGVLLETRPLEHQFLRLLDACVDDLGHVYLAGETE